MPTIVGDRGTLELVRSKQGLMALAITRILALERAIIMIAYLVQRYMQATEQGLLVYLSADHLELQTIRYGPSCRSSDLPRFLPHNALGHNSLSGCHSTCFDTQSYLHNRYTWTVVHRASSCESYELIPTLKPSPEIVSNKRSDIRMA